MSMNLSKSSIAVFGCAIVLMISGCATATIGNAPDRNPPKLLKSDNAGGVNQGKRDNVIWDRPGAFGPVPANLQATGDAACRAGGFAKASGYHPAALNVDGKPIAGGGYFCAY